MTLNPVRAKLVKRARDWRWSSVHAHLNPAKGDGLTDTGPVLDRVEDFAGLLRAGEDDTMSLALRRAESTGRPLAAKPSWHGSTGNSAAIPDRESAARSRRKVHCHRNP